jgi:aryl-alcohol dehydrogenase-like predicted oxidoreductase
MADPNYEWLRQFVTPDKIAKVKALTEIAADLGVNVSQLALAWLLRLPEVSSVITGASRVSQVHENLKAAEVKAKLTPDVLARIEEILATNPKA